MNVQDHPLQNAVVSQVLFSYCSESFDSVKTIRLVNRDWKGLSLPVWNSYTIPVNICLNQDRKADGDKNQEIILLSEFIVRKNEKTFPPRNFQLVCWDIENLQFISFLEVPYPKVNLTVAFWQFYGTFMRILTLTNCKLPHHCTLVDNLISTALPNLERLAIFDCQVWHNMGCNCTEVVDIFMEPLPRFADIVQHPKCKSLRIRKVFCKSEPAQLSWIRILYMFPNLEEISVRGQDKPEGSSVNLVRSTPMYRSYSPGWSVNVSNVVEAIYNTTVAQSVKHLDLLQDMCYPTRLVGHGELYRLQGLPLTKLTLDIGYGTERGGVQQMLQNLSRSLEELHLYRAPFSPPFSSFPCDRVMTQLTELYLWGNLCRNLTFMKYLPNLKTLSWNTSCYEEKDEGRRIGHDAKWEVMVPLFDGKIIKSTKKLGADFEMSSLERLEMDWGLIGESCWRKLGRWMPNLKRLKGAKVGDWNFKVVGETWPLLEYMEVAHGSEITPKGMVEAMSGSSVFSHLKEFTWKSCACVKDAEGEEERKEWERALEILRERVKGDDGGEGVVVVPWMRFLAKGKMEGKEEVGKNGALCAQSVFEKSVMSYAYI